MGIKQLTISGIVLGIFIISILTFGLQFQTENETPVGLADDESLSGLIVENEINLANSVSDIDNGSLAMVEGGGGALDSTLTEVNNPAIGSVARTVSNNPLKIFDSVLGMISRNIFGEDETFLNIMTLLSALLVMMFGWFIWKWIKSGDPE